MIRHFSIALVLIALSSFLSVSNASSSAKSCIESLNVNLDKPGGTLNYYIKEAEKTVEARGHRAPNFKNMLEDRLIVSQTTGTKGPFLLSKTLPANAYFVDHPLFMPNEPGIVKTATGGETVPLRVMVDYNGKKIGTNVLSLRTALFDNLTRDSKSLIPQDAKAIFVFMHGGGTKTTGSHVGISIANHLYHYGVATLAIDMPWHGEGPREFFRDSKDFFGWIRALLKQFAGTPNVPIILGGHSMGGEFADMYMRNYPHDDLVSAIISLSPPVDPVPGKTIHQRLMANANGYGVEASPEKLSEDSLQFLDDILIDGKNSPSGIYFESQISANNNWAIPADQGAGYLPSLFVWGAADYLYVGREKHIADYIGKLKNAEVKIYGERTVIGDKREVIGHLIFDHYAEDSEVSELEAYADIRNFIQKQLGQKLEKRTRKDEHVAVNFLNIIKEYSYNLAFREFVKTIKVTKKIPNNPEKLAAISAQISEMGRRMEKEVLSPDEKKTLKAQYDRLQDLRAGKYVPEGPEGDEGRQLEQAIDKIGDEINVANSRNKVLKKKIESLQSEINTKNRDLDWQLVNSVANSPLVKEAHDDYVAAVELLATQSAEVDKAINSQLQSIYRNGHTPTEAELTPPAELVHLFERYETVDYPEFAKKKEKYQQTLTHLAQTGAFGSAAKELVDSIAHLEAELSVYSAEDKNIQLIVFQGGIKSEAYRARVVELYNSELYRIESYSFENILEYEYEDMIKYTFAIQEYWKKWKQLWNDRVAGEKISLY